MTRTASKSPSPQRADPVVWTVPAGREPVVGSLCTGYGGLDLGVLTALGGGRLAWVADPDPAVGRILAARFPGVPNLGDITALDWTAVGDGGIEPVDVLTAGFPCQDISFAGRGAGITEGTRSGLWRTVADAVRGLRPALVVVENVAALRSKRGGLGIVLGGLAALGYDACWRSLRASDIGAAHRRDRVFLLAYPTGTRFVGVATDTVVAAVADAAVADVVVADAAGPRLAQPDPNRPAADRSGGGQPAGHGGATVADPGGPRWAWWPAAGAAAGPGPAGQPARRRHRTPHDSPADASIAADGDNRVARVTRAGIARAGGVGIGGGAVAADPGGGQPQRRRGPGPVAGPPNEAPGAGDQRQRDGHAAGSRGPTAAHPARGRGHARQPEPAQLLRAAETDRNGAAAAADPTRHGQPQQPDRGTGTPLRSGSGAGGRDQPGHPAGRAERAGWDGAGELAGHPTKTPDLTPDGTPDGALDSEVDWSGEVNWGEYTPAIQRWERVLGRPAPYPTEPGRTGRPRLGAAFVEWLMGLPPGWVTGVAGLSRAAQLRALGNGVIPTQAATAVSLLLHDALTDNASTDNASTDNGTHRDSDAQPDRHAGEAAAA